MQLQEVEIFSSAQLDIHLSHPPPHLLHVSSGRDGSLLEYYHPWEYFNSAQGDIHINNKDSESGMYDFRSVQITSLSMVH